jgi:uncharacterized protein (TIGR02328 family)
MRIWHPKLIKYIDNKRLLGQHHEIHGLYTIATKNRKAYRNHPLVKWAINFPKWLYSYHNVVANEMIRRNFNHKSPLIPPINTPYNNIRLHPYPGNPYTIQNNHKDRSNIWMKLDTITLDKKGAWLSEKSCSK